VLSRTITTEANEMLRAVHERMPVILTRDAEAAWLYPKTEDPAALLPLLKQYPAEEMEYYAVSREVNTPAVDRAGNIEPLKEGCGGDGEPLEARDEPLVELGTSPSKLGINWYPPLKND
jgi:hypothetical protein